MSTLIEAFKELEKIKWASETLNPIWIKHCEEQKKDTGIGFNVTGMPSPDPIQNLRNAVFTLKDVLLDLASNNLKLSKQVIDLKDDY